MGWCCLTWWILTDDTKQFIPRSMVWSALDPHRLNLRAMSPAVDDPLVIKRIITSLWMGRCLVKLQHSSSLQQSLMYFPWLTLLHQDLIQLSWNYHASPLKTGERVWNHLIDTKESISILSMLWNMTWGTRHVSLLEDIWLNHLKTVSTKVLYHWDPCAWPSSLVK